MAENKTENPGTEEMEVRLAQLNQFTRRTLTQEEVFLFDVRLCDNEIDRDGERFSLEALEQLKTLFVGKTGIFDHREPDGTALCGRTGTGSGTHHGCRRGVYLFERTRLHGAHRCQPGSDPGN